MELGIVLVWILILLPGKLWDTENGPDFGDEINLVDPGFNSGWKKVQGFWNVASGEKIGNRTSATPDNLVNFNGTGNIALLDWYLSRVKGSIGHRNLRGSIQLVRLRSNFSLQTN